MWHRKENRKRSEERSTDEKNINKRDEAGRDEAEKDGAGKNEAGRDEAERGKTEKDGDGKNEAENVKRKSGKAGGEGIAEEKTEAEMQQILAEYLKEEHASAEKKKQAGNKRFSGKALAGFSLKSAKTWSRKRKLAALAGTILILFVINRAACGDRGEALPVVTAAPLEKGDVTEVLSLSGPVSGTESADVVSNLHAEVLQIMVREGDRVKKDETLALIDSSDVSKEVEMAQNSYELAVSEYNENIRDTQNRYEKALQDYQTAQLNYSRNQVLFAAGDISSAEMEQISNALKDAAREVDSFTVENGRAIPDKSYELKVKSAQFELDQKKKDLENTEVKSPIDGTVVRVNSRVGQFADKPEDEKPMFVVENLDNLEMEIAVSEYSIGKVKVGQKASIDADILNGKTGEGEIISISPTGEEKGGGSTERVVPTTIRIDSKSSEGLIAGITAKASIITGEASGTFKIPQTSLIQNADGSVCVASVDTASGSGTVRMIPVTTGVESALEVEIFPVEEGTLTEGMWIVSSPAGLSDGMAVTVR